MVIFLIFLALCSHKERLLPNGLADILAKEVVDGKFFSQGRVLPNFE